MINEKIKSLQERRKELDNELSLYDLDTTDEEEKKEIESLESQIAEIDAEIEDNRKYFDSVDPSELKANMKNAKTEEEYIEAYREYKEYKQYTKSEIKKIVPIFGISALLVGGILGIATAYNMSELAPNANASTESDVNNNDNDNSTQNRIKDTTSVSSEQIDELLNEEDSTKTNSTTRTTNSTNTTGTIVTPGVPTQEPTTSTRIIINTTETPKKPTTTERTEIIPEVTTTEVPTTERRTTEATTTESTTETVIYDTTEEPTTADPYDPDMPIEEDEDDVEYYESSAKKGLLVSLKQELLKIKSSRKAIATQQVYTKILK